MQIKYGRENDYADFSHKQNQTADGRAIVQFMEVWSGMMECVLEHGEANVSETACMIVRNHRLVETAGLLLAVCNGVRRSGISAAAGHAQKLGREIIVIDPLTLAVSCGRGRA